MSTTITLNYDETKGAVTILPEQEEYDIDDIVSVTAIPATDYSFSYWDGDDTKTDNPINYTVTDSLNVSASFEEQKIRTTATDEVTDMIKFYFVQKHCEQIITNGTVWTGKSQTKSVETSDSTETPFQLQLNTVNIRITVG